MTINHDTYHKQPTENIRQALKHLTEQLGKLQEGAVTNDEFMKIVRDEMVDLTYETLSDIAMGWEKGDDEEETLSHEEIRGDLWDYANKVHDVFDFEFYGGKAVASRWQSSKVTLG